jgi:hypothetical protein
MKDFFKIRTTASELAEEHGAGEQGTPALVSKYKNATPGQNGSAPTGQQPARKGDKLGAKFEPVKEETEALDEGYSEQDAMYRKEAVKHAERVMKAVGSQYMSGCKYHARALQDMADEMENTIEYRKKDEANMKAMRAAQTKVGY